MEENTNKKEIRLPTSVQALLASLWQQGFAAYAVGGCVRDSLLGRTPSDWDICTAARPAEIRQVFSGCRQILTGEKHGTVAVLVEGTAYEITTYRVDGCYTDGRHPDAVRFVPDLREDLARRDFTINAMAFAPQQGIVDEFGGQSDLAAGCIRCVGAPEQRFAEDALRILRAVRFAAQLGFALDKETEKAALALRDTVCRVSAERIFTELDKLLAGAHNGEALSHYGKILGGVLPEVLPCMGINPPSRWHCFDVWQHTAAAVQRVDTEGEDERGARILHWAMFFHDLAKPECCTVDANGRAYFHDHNENGAKLAREILARLKAPAYLAQEVCALVAVHDCPLPADDPSILRLLGQYGEVSLRRLCRVKYADLDAHAQGAHVAARKAEVQAFERRMHTLAQSGCFTVAGLHISGADVLAQGVPAGPGVGEALNRLLDAVMDGALPNTREALLDALDSERKAAGETL